MRLRSVLLLLTAMLVASCATTPPPPAYGQPDLLGFLQDGRTTRADAYLKLGPPGREFENGRIASWRLDRDAGGYFLVSSGRTGWRGARYELVVIFGEDGVAQRHSLVEVRGIAE